MIDPVLLDDYYKTRLSPAAYPTALKAHEHFCYAPFSNLYFAHEGKALACCENRSHLLGTYPQQSIAEIWTGAAASKLRQYISELNLGYGCKGCDFDLQSRNFGGVKAKAFDYARIMQRDLRYPAMMEFELENTCNLECVMCSGVFSSSIRKNREKLPPIPTPYDDEFVRQLEEFIPHLQLANFFGGEPFLVEIYLKIWEKMSQLNPGMNIWVTTNGTILNNRIRQLLERMKFNLTISVDSLHKATYEKIRVNSVLERMLENFKWFLQYTKSAGTDFTVNTCPMIPNWRGLPDIVQWGCDEGFVVNIIAVRYPGHLSLGSLSAAELEAVLAHYRSIQISGTDDLSRRNKKSFEDYIGFVEQWRSYQREKEKIISDAALHPLEAIRRRIRVHLLLSSGSEESKEVQMGQVDVHLQRQHEFFRNIHPLFAEPFWKLKLDRKPEELLLEAIGTDEIPQLAGLKTWAGNTLDNWNDAFSEKDIHLKRLEIYLNYYNRVFPPDESLRSGYSHWLRFTEKISAENEILRETFFRVINKGSIALFAEFLQSISQGSAERSFAESLKFLKAEMEAELSAAGKNQPGIDEFIGRAHERFITLLPARVN